MCCVVHLLCCVVLPSTWRDSSCLDLCCVVSLLVFVLSCSLPLLFVGPGTKNYSFVGKRDKKAFEEGCNLGLVSVFDILFVSPHPIPSCMRRLCCVVLCFVLSVVCCLMPSYPVLALYLC